MHPVKVGSISLLLMLISACQNNSHRQIEHQFDLYEQAARTQIKQHFPDDWQTRSEQQPETRSSGTTPELSIHDAQRLAFEHSVRITGILTTLGIQNAQATQQTLSRNPGLELSLMRPENGGRWQVEFSLSSSLLDWLSRQRRLELAEAEKLLWQTQAWQQLDEEFSQIREYWLAAVGARQKLGVHRELSESAAVAADFAHLLYEAGNVSELDWLSTQSIADQRMAQQIQAELAAINAEKSLRLFIGVSDKEHINLPETLPAIGGQAISDIDQLEQHLMQQAMLHQPGLQLAAHASRQSDAALALARQRLALQQSGLGVSVERESNGELKHGLSLSVAAPIFDSGITQLSIFQGQRELADNHAHWLEMETRAAIHSALLQINSSQQEIQLLTDSELPRFQRMMMLSLQEYNFMLRGTFELLAVTDRILDARLRLVDATLTNWQARSTLGSLVGSTGPLNLTDIEVQHD